MKRGLEPPICGPNTGMPRYHTCDHQSLSSAKLTNNFQTAKIMDENLLSKYFNSEIREMKRSEIHPADYNPRGIDKEGLKNLKRSLKEFGVLGGIIVNSRTDFTVVGGHQKIALLDEFHKYPDNDYTLRVEVIDVDEKTEKTINIALNNPNVGGFWDFEKMRQLIPDIDYRAAGLNDADLNMIGVDFLHQTEEETAIAGELEALMAEADEEKQREKAERRKARLSADTKEFPASEDEEYPGDEPFGAPDSAEAERRLKVDHMKEVKQQVREKAQTMAENMEAYVMISFDTWEAKAEFCKRFGYSPAVKFIKGEVFSEQVERIE